MLGFRSLTELQKRDPKSLLAPEYRDKIYDQIAGRMRGAQVPKRFEFKAIRKDGRVIQLEVYADLIVYDGRPAIQGSFRDVTQQNALLQEVVETRDYLQSLIEHSRDGIITVDRNEIIRSWNRGAEEIYGYRAEEVVGRSLFVFDPREIRAERKRMFKKVWDGQALLNLELERVRKDGQRIWVDATLSPLRDASGKVISASVIVKDISQRKLLEQQLRVSEERYRTLFEESKDMVFISDLGGRFIDVNPAGVAMFGYPSKEEMLKIDIAQDLYINPKDRKRFQEKMDRDGYVLNYVHELKKQNGEPIIVLETSTAVRDESGRVVAYRGILRDITEQRRLEQSTRESEERYRNLFELASDAILLEDISGKIIDANQKACQLLGYSRNEFLRLNVRDIVRSEIEERLQDLVATLRERRSLLLEALNRHKDGHWIEVEVSIRLITLGGLENLLVFIRDISERKKLERSLRESEVKYRTLIEQSMDAISITHDGRHLFVNSSYLSMFAYQSKEEVIGQDIQRNVAQEDQLRIVELSLRRQAGEEVPTRYEYTGIRSDGTPIEVEVLVTQIEYEGKTAAFSFHRDITERKRFERELLQRTRQLEALDEVNTTLNESIELEEILSNALQRIVSSQRYNVGAILVTQTDGQTLRLSASSGYSTNLTEAFSTLNVLEGITGLVGRTKQLVVVDVEDYPSYLPYKSLFESAKIFSNAFIPLLSKGNVVGVLHVGRRKSTINTVGDVRFLNAVANQLGVAIENAQLYQKVKQSEERYRSVLESISDVVYKASSTGEILFMSPNVERLVGYRPVDFYQRKGLWMGLVHPEDRHSLDEVLRQSASESRHHSVEYRMLPRGKAEYIWVRDSLTPTTDGGGKVTELYGVISAITERKKLEREIHDSEQMLRKVIDSMGDALIVTDLRGIVREVNREFERMTGYTRRETLGQEFPYRWVHEEELSRMVEWVNALRERGYLHDFDLTMVNKKGDAVFTSLNTTLLRNELGEPIAMLSIVRDITERKRLTEELRHRTRQIELLNRIIGTANRSMNFEEVFATIVKEVRELVPFDELSVALVHPGQRNLELYAVESNLDAETSQRGASIPLGKTISKFAIKKGKAVLVRDLARYPNSASYEEGFRSQISIPFYSKGEVIGTLNVASMKKKAFSGSDVQILQPIADQIGGIVDRIRLFEKVSDDAAYIRNLLDSMDSVVYTVDHESRIQEVNKAWKDFAIRSGMPDLADERSIQGKHILDTVRDSALRESYQTIIHNVLTGDTPYYSREFAQKGPTEERVYQMRVNPMLINDRVTGIVFTNTDITEIKKTEAALRRRNEELLALNEIATLVSTSLRLGQILGAVAPKIQELLEAQGVAIYLAEKDTKNLQLVEQVGLDDRAVGKIRRLDIKQSATGTAVERGEPLFVSEGLANAAGANVKNVDLSADERLRSFAAIPLRSKEKILGALDVFYSKPKEFTRQDQQILLLLATQLGSAVENALLYEQISDQLKRLMVLYELSQKLTSSLELEDICRNVYDQVETIIPLDSFIIELLDVQNRTIKGAFAVDLVNGKKVFARDFPPMGRENDQSVSWKVAMTKRSILENGRLVPPEGEQAPATPVRESCSSMCVPMLSKERIIGIMSVQSYSPVTYTETQLRLLESVANLTAIALEKASLYEETVRKSSEIEERNKELDDFTYVVSHDLKEPLVTIEGYSNILLKDFESLFPLEGKEYLHTISDSCGRMKSLIDDLLILSRLGRVTEIAEPVSVYAIIEDIRSDLEFTIEEKNAELTVQENIPTIMCNETQIRIVFRNLIANGLKFNNSPKPKVHVGYVEESRLHHFFVQDNGIGIDKQYFDRIFSIFQQLHPNEEYGGTGAGLTIVKKVIENHRGMIWVESTVGSGSTFHFTIPRDLVEGQWSP